VDAACKPYVDCVHRIFTVRDDGSLDFIIRLVSTPKFAFFARGFEDRVRHCTRVLEVCLERMAVGLERTNVPDLGIAYYIIGNHQARQEDSR
jgi:hypothetical protein